jgi:hypothetical protein
MQHLSYIAHDEYAIISKIIIRNNACGPKQIPNIAKVIFLEVISKNVYIRTDIIWLLVMPSYF